MNLPIKLFGIVFIVLANCARGEEKPPLYSCLEIPGHSIRLDGKPDEQIWTKATEISLYDIEDASIPRYPVDAKLLKNNQFLYITLNVADTEVSGTGDTLCTRPHEERDVLNGNSVIEIFIDPDGDGKNYMEIHINSEGQLADKVFDYPPPDGARRECEIDFNGEATCDNKWNCDGLRATVNITPDKGWTTEVAVPLKSIGQLADARILLVHHRKIYGESLWWSWPVLKIKNCHYPSRWGTVNFEK